MNIGFDFDKIFVDYPPFVPSWLIDRLYKSRRKKILSYRIPNKPEQVFRRITHWTPLRPVIKSNLDALKKYSGKKNNHYLISSRFSFLKKHTDSVLRKNHLNKLFRETYFNFKDEQPHEFKSRILKELKLQRYIDDDLKLLQYLAKRHQKTKFFWLNSKERKKISDNLTAIRDFKDVFK